MLSANNIDQSIGYFYATESRLNNFVIFKNNALQLKYTIMIGGNHDAMRLEVG